MDLCQWHAKISCLEVLELHFNKNDISVQTVSAFFFTKSLSWELNEKSTKYSYDEMLAVCNSLCDKDKGEGHMGHLNFHHIHLEALLPVQRIFQSTV